MNGFAKLILPCVGALVLSACAGTELQRAQEMSPQGSAFNTNLYKGYVDLAASEYAEADYWDSDAFAMRAISAGSGQLVGPEQIDRRTLPEDKVGELMDARRRLTMALSTGAAEQNPAEAARAQVMFDCWMQEQEENFQPEDIARCRGAMMAALDILEAQPVATAAPAPKLAPVPGPYVVFFDTDSFELDEKSLAIIKEAAGNASSAEVMKAVLSGHTDTVGSDGYNKGLSRARVVAVGNALMEAGVSRKIVEKEYYGKTRLRVATPDNTENPENRRVEINFDR
jgi:outer membrane protein OmpA-like peptidoglycan-associated protein